jgi:uncharacterized protein (TIGR02145 family)
MKKSILLAVYLFAFFLVSAQPPQAFKYQAVVRNNDGSVKADETVAIQIEILQGSADGSTIYLENHNKQTSSIGLVDLVIGKGTTTDDITAIDWSMGPYYLEVLVNGTSLGVSQLLSVPYAMHAKTAESVTGEITESDPFYAESQAAKITADDITNLSNLSGINSGDQDLSSLATQTALEDTASHIRADIPDVSGFLTSENQTLEAVLTINNSAGDKNITNLADPVNDQDAVTKVYVDALLARIIALEEQDLLNNGFSDTRDSNHYDVVKIGNQIWMAENLAYLPSVNQVADGSEDIAGSYYYVYDYDGTSVSEAKATTNFQTYGVLYNWTAALEACPAGWHLPTDAEWKILEMQLGMSQQQADSILWRGTDEGGKLKETGTAHWDSPNTGATDESDFTALPGGRRLGNGSFYIIGSNGNWWSATEDTTENAWYRYISFDSSKVSRTNWVKEFGFSVRCIKDD